MVRSSFRLSDTVLISLAILLIPVNLYAQAAIPSFKLPVPKGSYSVGTLTWYLVDKDRSETIADAVTKQRELMVRVWYPASNSSNKTSAAYTDQTSAAAMEKRFNLARGFEAQIQTHSIERAPFARTESPCPVVMLEHGLGMVPAVYTSLAEGLASFGFVVVGTNHTYTSMVTVFPDGKKIEYKAPWPTNVERKVQGAAMGRYLDVWVSDVRFVMNELQELNQHDKFWRGRLDLAKVGIVGHSYGGTTSGLATRSDRRILAGVNLDGSIYPGMEPPVNVGKPYLIITTNESSNIHSEFAGAQGNSYAVTIKGSNHMSFTDVNLLRATFAPTNGSVKTDQTMDILENTRALVIELFSKYLKGELAPHLDTETIIIRK